MFKKLKKFIVIALLVSLLIPLTARPAQAFFTPTLSYPAQFWNAVFNTEEMNLQSFVFEAFKATGMSVVSLIYCGTCAPQTKPLFGGSAVEFVSNAIAFMYANPPASGVQYLAYLGNKIDLVPEAYAQTGGEGFGRMLALLPVWQAFRNISYAFFVIILLFIGFGIMFRIKVSPQAVMTLQAALPRIILSLVLVTFSYAIVGLLLDLMLVLSNLAISVFWTIPGLPEFMKNAFPEEAITSSWGFLTTMLRVGGGPVGGVMKLVGVVLGLPAFILAFFTGGVSFAAPLLVLIFLVIVFFIALVKVFWTLLKAYVNIVLSLVFAPFQIMVGALPGVPAIGSWFKNLLANLLVFPTVLVMVFLAGYLAGSSVFGLGISDLVSQFISGTADNAAIVSQISQALDQRAGSAAGAGDIGNMFMLFLVSLGMLLMAPKAADMIKGFMTGKPYPYGAGIGEAMGAAGLAGFVGSTLTGGAQRGLQTGVGNYVSGFFPTKVGTKEAPLAPKSSSGASRLSSSDVSFWKNWGSKGK